MKSIFLVLSFIATGIYTSSAQISAPDKIQTSLGPLTIQPIQHASLILTVNGITIYADPSGADNFKGMTGPDLILITDIHGDHFDLKTLVSFSRPLKW